MLGLNYAECRKKIYNADSYYAVIILSVVMLRVVMLSVVNKVILLSVANKVITLSVIMLSVAVPF
jgi:hypothetical protein